MLDGQRGQVGVRHQIPACLAVREHLLKDHPVPLRGLNEAGARLVQPALHSCLGLGEREGLLEDPGIGADANKCAETTTQLRQTASDPDSCASHQDRACRWRGLRESSA